MSAPTFTVALTRHREPNTIFWQALDGISRQQVSKFSVLVLDQIGDPDTERYVRDLSRHTITFEYIKTPTVSLSFARNEALRLAKTDLVLFLDADAVPSPGWAKSLARVLSKPDVAVAGGKIRPLWHKSPVFLARSALVQEFYSLLDLGDNNVETPKIVGANFGINKALLADEARFDLNLGYRPGFLIGGEETDLCARAIALGLKVMYAADAVVEHQISSERISYKWIAKRAFRGGYARRVVGGLPRTYHNARGSLEYVIIAALLPCYGIGYVTRLAEEFLCRLISAPEQR